MADEFEDEAAECEPVIWETTSMSTNSSLSDHFMGSENFSLQI